MFEKPWESYEQIGECIGPDVREITQLEKAHIQILVLLITKDATAGGW